MTAGRPKEYKDRISIMTNVEKEEYDRFKKIARRENRTITNILSTLISDYNQKHASGNPVYSLGKWVENPEFIAIPALMSDPNEWFRFLTKCDGKTKNKVIGHFYKLREMFEFAEVQKSPT